jgi:tetratricopeptide (TPR) repeat protein
MDQLASTRRPVAIPGAEVVRHVMEAYERGHTLEALRRAESFAPLAQWHGVEGCIIAARISANTGAPRLSTRMAVRALRADRDHTEALSQYGYETLTRRGPLALWRLLRTWREDGGATPEQAAELLALKARAAIDLRDFATGEALIARAESLDPSRPWVRLQRAFLLERLDRLEESLEVAASAASLHPHPFYRPATQARAHLLQLLDRDDDAIQLLQGAMQELQNGSVAGQLYSLLSENGRWAEAEAALEQYLVLSPLLEPRGKSWLRSQQARVAYHLGKPAEAARFASELEDDFHKGFAQRLLDPASGSAARVELDVSFVRQHFKTCAPATLAAIGAFWKLSADHVRLAEAMCYDGTPPWEQRDWAEKNGWRVREFRVTKESALALLSAGMPFAISTVDATSAHMMAVIGYDPTRDTVLMRDPAQPYVIEWQMQEFLDRYRAFGPRGMAFVPQSEGARLDPIELPDAVLYDHNHRFCLALARHDREVAVAELARIEAEASDSMLCWEARFDLAVYDDNPTEQLRCIDELLKLFPGNAARTLRRLGCMHQAPRHERIQFLETACAPRDADPALHMALARTLQGDARDSARSLRLLKRALRLRQMDSSGFRTLADLLWESEQLEEATECYRFAAFLDGFREYYYQVWFVACRRTRRTEEALEHLQDRYQRFGQRSEQPALTLAWAWNEVDQPHRAREVLESAIRLRPTDGQLMLRAAGLIAGLSEPEEAARLLASARGRVRESDWLRVRMEIAEKNLDFESVAQMARELLQREPVALDVHNSLIRALARREGTAVALRELQQACAAFPHHCGLRRIVVEWSREAGPAAMVEASQELLRLEPSDAWAFRELAFALSRLDRHDEALHAAHEAMRIEPTNSYNASTLGFIHRRVGRVAEAREQFRQAISWSVDNNYAIDALLELARSDKERTEDVALVERELLHQVVSGDGLLAYLDVARPILDPEALLAIIRRAHGERPDLWHAWGALISQLVHMLRLDEALTIATQATERFPYLPRTWLELATVHQRRNEPKEEIAALERSFEINPGWNSGALALTAALGRAGRFDDARATFEKALRHSPLDPLLHAGYASLLWRQRLPEQAFAAIEHALLLSPAYEYAWDHLYNWAEQSGDPQRLPRFARALTQERPGEARVWLMLARNLPDSEVAERLAAIDRALQLDSRSVEAWDRKAELLVVAERFEEAIEVCREGVQACTADLHILQGRRAWIEVRRRRHPEAVRLMREVLAENRSYAWGWHQLVTWLLETGATDEAATALQTMRQLWPHDTWVNRQLGYVALKRKDPAAAREAFARAMQSSPTDVSSAHNLVDLQFESADLDGAAATLQVMHAHQPGAATLAVEAKLRLRRGDVAGACETLKELSISPDPDSWPLEAATAAFIEAKQIRAALRVLRPVPKQPSANPQTGVSIIELFVEKRDWIAATLFFLRLGPGELRRRAAPPLLHALAQHQRKMLIRLLLWRRRDVLHADDASWGRMGFALSNIDLRKGVVSWLRDWRERREVEPWMLFNYCLALRQLGDYEEAMAVARHVVQTWGHREGAEDMHLFLAVDEALAGNVPAAEEHLKLVAVRDAVTYDQQLLSLAKALVEFQSMPREERLRRFNELRLGLQKWFVSGKISTPDVRRTFRRAGDLFAREGAGRIAWLWSRWLLHSNGVSWLVTLLAILLVGLFIWVRAA